jgi:hypothetical protein
VIVPRDPQEPITVEMRDDLGVAWPDAARLAAAWRIARDLEALELLLGGQPIERDRLDPEGVEWAEELRLVQLRAPLELVDVLEPATA